MSSFKPTTTGQNPKQSKPHPWNRKGQSPLHSKTHSDNPGKAKVLTCHDPSSRDALSEEDSQQKNVVKICDRERRHTGGKDGQ
jgi:hypothetical protein